MDQLIAAAVEVGLDRFTLASVAEHVGAAESTVYNYVSGREQLYWAAAASVFATLDVDARDAGTWAQYVDEVASRVGVLAQQHPGLREYVLLGPYEPSTLERFESIVAHVRRLRPDITDHVAFIVASRPVVLTLEYVGNPVFEPNVAWMRRALIRGFDEMIADGPMPPAPARSWRVDLRVR